MNKNNITPEFAIPCHLNVFECNSTAQQGALTLSAERLSHAFIDIDFGIAKGCLNSVECSLINNSNMANYRVADIFFKRYATQIKFHGGSF